MLSLKKDRAKEEQSIVEFGYHLSEMLLQMGFYSESDFGRFLHEATQ
jgi:hypothetical protein